MAAQPRPRRRRLRPRCRRSVPGSALVPTSATEAGNRTVPAVFPSGAGGMTGDWEKRMQRRFSGAIGGVALTALLAVQAAAPASAHHAINATVDTETESVQKMKLTKIDWI